jgi:hypothetical protein
LDNQIATELLERINIILKFKKENC